ncbi:MAG: DUF4157 domain-containing protein [Myxococcota bacterium]
MSKSLAPRGSAGPAAARAPAPAGRAPTGAGRRQDQLGNAEVAARGLGSEKPGSEKSGSEKPGSDKPGARERFPYQHEMEASFGEDFSTVDIVFGAAAAMADLGAEAAAEGERIQFADANPDKEIVAHELAHVVQRRHSGVSGATGGSGDAGVSRPEDAAEREASRVGKEAAAGKAVAPRAPTSAGTMRFTPAKQDKYNDASVDNNGKDEGKDLRMRPGVVLDGEDTFQTTAITPLYFGNGKQRTELPSGTKVCINPADPRKLNGETCLLVWAGSVGAGWAHAGDIEHGYELVRKIKKSDRYQDWQPSSANKGEDTTTFVFKTDGPTTTAGLRGDPADRVFPDQTKSANTVAHHLLREGKSEGKEDDYYNVFMNLPQKNGAAVAHDVAQPGEEFHVPKQGGSFLKRRVETFDKGSDKSKDAVTFVFGYVEGKAARRGWVVYDCLERKQP